MAKGVLGNDPFQRGAALRPEKAEPAAEVPSKPTVTAAPQASEKKKAGRGGKSKGTTDRAAMGEVLDRALNGRVSKEARPKKRTEKSQPTAFEAHPGSPVAVELRKLEAQSATPVSVTPHPASPVLIGVRTPGKGFEKPQAVVGQLTDEQRASSPDEDETTDPFAHPASSTGASVLDDTSSDASADAEEAAPAKTAAKAQSPAPSPARETAHAGRPSGRAEIEDAVLLDDARPKTPRLRVEARDVEAGELVRVPTRAHEGASPNGSLRTRAVGMFSFLRDRVGEALESDALRLAHKMAGGGYRALLTGLGSGGSLNLDDYGKDPDLVDSISPLADVLFERYWRVTVEGAERVPRGRVILVANHSGALPVDGPILHHTLSRERKDLESSRWLVEDQVFHAPFIGVLLNRLGAIRANPENAMRLLDEERPLIVFPEGIQGIGKHFQERYQLKRFGRGGFVKLARRAKAPILPVAIVGAEETSPLLGKLPGGMFGLPYLPVTSPIPLPAKWRIRFGAPLDASEGPDDVGNIQRLTERTRESIQGMLRELLAQRTSVFAS